MKIRTRTQILVGRFRLAVILGGCCAPGFVSALMAQSSPGPTAAPEKTQRRVWNPNMVVPLSQERIAALPGPEREAWQQYWDRSVAAERQDRTTLEKEGKDHGLSQPIPTLELHGSDFEVDPHKPASWYESEEAQKLAVTILSYQHPDGGWSKLIDYPKGPRPLGATFFPVTHPDKVESFVYASTFDNHATTEQMLFLARSWQATKKDEYRQAVLRGFDYIMAAQYLNGGWPQFYPLTHVYHDGITFNDDAMTHVLEFLQDVADNRSDFAFIDDERRQRAHQAVEKGIRLILKAQVVRDGQPTVWGAQHDPLTLEVAGARRQEPPSLSGGESADVVKFLMHIKTPSPEIVRSIEGALAWFDKVKVSGFRKVDRDGGRYYEVDPTLKSPQWARFYDVTTNKPLFSGHEDGIVYDSFQEMWDHGNRPMYNFYTQLPLKVVTVEQANWRKMLAQEPTKTHNP